MVTHVDVSLSLPEIFPAMELVSDKREDTEDPTPKPEERIAYCAKPRSEQEWQDDERQEHDHEDGEHETDPDLVQKT